MLKESLRVFTGHGNVMIFEKFANQPRIGTSGKLQSFKSVRGTKFRGEYLAKRFDSRATRPHEGAINVEYRPVQP